MTKERTIAPCPVCGGKMSLEKSPYGDTIMHGFRCGACRYESPSYFAESIAIEAHNEQAALILSRAMPTAKTTTPMRVRNEAAVCGNCPYFAEFHGRENGHCGCSAPDARHGFPTVASVDCWCGQHPDFWR